MSVPVEVGVSYESDLKKVERVTLEVAAHLQKTSAAAVPTFAPAVRFHTLGELGIKLTVVLRAKDVTEQSALKHDFIKLLHECYHKEGIEIPFPQRPLQMQPK